MLLATVVNIIEEINNDLLTAATELTLTLYGPNSFFRRFSGHNLR